jgi:hypothetical protein
MTQLEAIKAHLLSGKSITSLEALFQFGCLRLGARIYDLKRQGMKINSTMIEVNKKHVSKYYLNFN